ncbi:hypothetical protein D9M68_738240 [compost metagenome]
MAKASHDFSSVSSFVSTARLNGTCSSEHDGAIHSSPWCFSATGLSLPSATSTSVRQMLRPSTTPTDSTLCAGSQSATPVSSCGARTASTCRPATGSWQARRRFSDSGEK